MMPSKKYTVGLVLGLAVSFSVPLQAGYRATLNAWTQSKQWYSAQTFKANVIWRATYFSPEFRRAFSQRHVKKSHLEPLAAARFVAEQEERQARFHEFFIDLYARKPYHQFSLGEESFWDVVLVTKKGEIVEPLSIEAVEITPYEEVMFPYVTRWSKGYRVTFPKAALGEDFRLSLRGVIGKSDLKWD